MVLIVRDMVMAMRIRDGCMKGVRGIRIMGRSVIVWAGMDVGMVWVRGCFQMGMGGGFKRG